MEIHAIYLPYLARLVMGVSNRWVTVGRCLGILIACFDDMMRVLEVEVRGDAI